MFCNYNSVQLCILAVCICSSHGFTFRLWSGRRLLFAPQNPSFSHQEFQADSTALGLYPAAMGFDMSFGRRAAAVRARDPRPRTPTCISRGSPLGPRDTFLTAPGSPESRPLSDRVASGRSSTGKLRFVEVSLKSSPVKSQFMAQLSHSSQ